MKVSKIMKKVMIIDDYISVKEAAQIMNKKGLGSLVIVKNNKIRGIITQRDVLRNISNLEQPVKKIMVKKVITINHDKELKDAAILMIKHHIERIPVLQNGTLKGMVKIMDVLLNLSKEGDDFLIN